MRSILGFFCISWFLLGTVPSTLNAENAADSQTVNAVTGSEVYQRIKKHVDQIRIIDTHEHLFSSEKPYLKQPADFLCRMLDYVESDLVSAGMPRAPRGKPLRVKDLSVPLPERWAIFQKYWKEVRFTGYGRALHRTTKDLYGIDLDTVTPETAHLLNEKIAATNKPGLFRYMLKEKARIDLSISDIGRNRSDPEFFANVRRFDRFIRIRGPQSLEALTKETGVKIDSVDDLSRAFGTAFSKAVKDGIVGVKSALAYDRRISYPFTTKKQAEAAFAKLKSGKPVFESDLYPLQNYMMHEACRLTNKQKLPFQFHTGLQTGSGNTITNSKPTDLVNLIMAYPNMKFVIFHGSYPYGHELSTMAKNFPNVYIDMCWLDIISPKIAEDSLSEWLETVPANKITGFGGDYGHVELVYGHAEMAREVVARTLAQKVLGGYLTEAEACELADKVLRNNAIELYQLKLPKVGAEEGRSPAKPAAR